MNSLQLLAFLVFVGSVLGMGSALYRFFNPQNEEFLNRYILIGEILLLGSIALVGEMLLLSLLHLYWAVPLWGVVLANYGVFFSKSLRQWLKNYLLGAQKLDGGGIFFFILLGIYIFRNFYFLVDVDSHSTYLFAQKLWLEHKTSIFGSPALDIRIFVPHFNAVPYALGLALWPKELFFPQLVVVFWGILALILIYGYTTYRINSWAGLGATMLVLFDMHFFYSGANACCIINHALTALLFAGAYNFWESREKRQSFRFTLAVVFLLQLMANKYQMFYITVFFLLFGLALQKHKISKLRFLFGDKRQTVVFWLFLISMGLWYLKNLLATGVPTFPILADKFHIFNWTPPMSDAFNRIYAGAVAPSLIIKYLSYFFVWPGMLASKLVLIIFCLFPFLLGIAVSYSRINIKEISEIGYWVGVSLLFIVGLCLVSFVDPRHYRYGLAIFSFTFAWTVFSLWKNFIGKRGIGIVILLILLVGAKDVKIVFSQGGSLRRPSLSQNLKVLTNQLKTQDVIYQYFPANRIVEQEIIKYKDKIPFAAWDTGIAGKTNLSAFLLPTRLQVGLWHTTVVKWDSYSSVDKIPSDLKSFGIKWVMRVENGHLIFLSPQKYAAEALCYNRSPQGTAYNYGFPAELSGEKRKECEACY